MTTQGNTSLKRWLMLINSQPCDPAVHAAAMKMARRFVWIIQAVLREEERLEALREAYNVAREELETFTKETSKPCETQP